MAAAGSPEPDLRLLLAVRCDAKGLLASKCETRGELDVDVEEDPPTPGSRGASRGDGMLRMRAGARKGRCRSACRSSPCRTGEWEAIPGLSQA